MRPWSGLGGALIVLHVGTREANLETKIMPRTSTAAKRSVTIRMRDDLIDRIDKWCASQRPPAGRTWFLEEAAELMLKDEERRAKRAKRE